MGSHKNEIELFLFDFYMGYTSKSTYYSQYEELFLFSNELLRE